MTRPLPDAPDPIVTQLFYPGELTLIGGAPGIGKTRMALHLAYGLASGLEGWWGQYDPMPILYCAQRSMVSTAIQMRTVGLNDIPDLLNFFCPADLDRDQRIDFENNPIRYLERNVLNTGPIPEIVFMDVLYTYIPPSSPGKLINLNNYTELARGCNELYLCAQKYQFAVTPLHHTAKQKTDSKHEEASERILGSQAIAAAINSSCILDHAIPNNSDYLRVYRMCRFDKTPAVQYFNGDDFSEVSEMEATTEKFTDATQVQLGPAELKILDQVSANPILLSEIAQLCKDKFDMEPNNTYNILTRLQQKGRIIVDGTRRSRTACRVNSEAPKSQEK
jgi:hypothetical protein